ncbi:GNAT family N-acetyltransferase [Providencia manganoxydans]|uniref:GNAT family N-acetyltransferase n=1 Tax=Providencia manganoxydans TaxID=2923283 RepID=UPI0034E415CF
MNIYLREITKDNFEAVSLLDVYEEQEDFIASNTWSMLEADYNPEYIIRAIYLKDTPVGFFMWVPTSSQKIAIWRFMVDKKHQHKGIGRQAMHLALAEIKQDQQLKQIEICYDPKNRIAKSFYSSLGFMEIGLDEDGEEMLAIINL